ncbi:MAG: Helix-turn-helix domain [Candidatus Krumholzibacteriota bacterium]|nr:Helix-turn-helix domain [Candidatus Krumholzibacteriota bacterium]
MYAVYANVVYMETSHLGQEIRRLRLRAGITLRGLATRVQVSAAHLSDIEHNRRRPSEKLLRSITSELEHVGATFEAFDRLGTGIDPETREWIASTPGVRKLLRAVKESGSQPQEILHEILPLLEKRVARKKNGKRKSRKIE